MGRKTKEEAQATRELLLDTAERLFSELGVSSTSLNEIACAAGLTRGAVYWHFENKGDLLMALWERVALPIRQAFENGGEDLDDDYLGMIRRKSCWMAEHIESDERLRALMNILMLRCDFTGDTGNAREHFLGEREHCLEMIRTNFVQAVSAGQLPLTVDPERAAIGLLGLTDGICFHWLIAPERFPIRETTYQAVDAYLLGLRGLR